MAKYGYPVLTFYLLAAVPITTLSSQAIAEVPVGPSTTSAAATPANTSQVDTPHADSAAASAQPAAPQPISAEPAKTIRLEFRNQPWPAVLEWLAETRKLNLDWQQLPQGTLNLVSTKEYSIDDAQDLINMQLLARGFTLLQRGEVLRIAPLDKIDITLVPKVTAEELATLPRHQFVRVSFPLDWMIAEEAATEFKPLISPYGQLFPMASSNRLEAMDAVVNLRELHRLLTRAEADEGRRDRVAEFRLQHRKAAEVAVKVRQLLGLPAETARTDATQTQLDIEKTKFRSEAVKQLGTNAQPLLVDKPDVHLVVNEEENSILVNGRADKIEIARQAVAAMDKPLPPGESSWESINRVKVYEVSGFDPATITTLMQALQQRGNLSKETRIQHEAAFNRLVVFASPEDQVTIANVIASFRTQGRRAEVLPLARIDPQYATKAVKLVLKNPDRPSSAPGVASEGEFQVEPDMAHNRLLLWATPAEVSEVREFLERLGESFTTGLAASQMHVVHLRGAEAPDVTDRLKKVWKDISKSPLVIDGDNSTAATTIPSAVTAPSIAIPIAPPVAVPINPAPPAIETDKTVEPMSDRSAELTPAQFVVQQKPIVTETTPTLPPPSPESSPASAQTAAPATSESETMPPVHVIAGNDGDMVILSRDPIAAETAKQFVEQIVPTADDVQVVELKHAQAALVKTQLDLLLEHTRSTANSSALNTDPPLKIEADLRTNRLMIQHATTRQMRLINEMVPQLDRPEQENERLVRQQRVYRAQRKRAGEIAEIVKEVYRDLLSSSDKVFAGRDAHPFGYNRALAATTKSPEYQGLLAVGVDDEGNSLILSAPAYLMEEVMRLVAVVDTSAGGESVRVVPLKSAAARASVGEALKRLLAKPE
jgi:type II secretory pathway component GspD/PulD (secretin)